MAKVPWRFFVAGMPEPAGSPQIIRIGKEKKAAIAWQKGPKWTRAVARALQDAIPAEERPLISGPVAMTLRFYVPRPANPKFEVPATPPDMDKLERATLDGLTFRDHNQKRRPLLIEDDARVVEKHTYLYYAGRVIPPGVEITVWPAGEGDTG